VRHAEERLADNAAILVNAGTGSESGDVGQDDGAVLSVQRPPDLRWDRVGTKVAKPVGRGECVEVGQTRSLILIRDSKNQDGLVLPVSERQWRVLVEHIKAEEAECEPALACID
jgi:hypothetical protein